MTGKVPPGWTKTTRDLSPDRPWSAAELEWAQEYERSLLRTWARFPKDGELYEATRDTPVSFSTHWKAPFTGGGKGILRKGTRVKVRVYPFNPEPIGVAAEPLDKKLEEDLVELRERTAKGYAGFSLSIGTESLNRDFILVGGAE